nr:hypothetical protein BaRGS_031906 [Batillaria attramentaria]
MFIVSLAVADLIVGMTVMPISTFYIFAGHWPFGVAVCQIWIGIDYTASTASILNLFILSLDRYWSVRAPLQYLHKRTRRRALSMISLVWVVSSLWVIPIAGWHYFAHGGVRTVPADVCDTEYAKNSVFKVVTAFFNFYLPLTIMYALYIRVFIEIRKRSVFELGQRNPGRRRLSFHVKANPAHCRSQDDEDSGARDEDTFTEDRLSRDRGNQETSMTSLQRFQHCGGTPNSNRKPRSIAGSKFRSYGTAPLRSKKKSADGTPALTKFSLSCDILPSPSRDPCVGSKCKAAVDTSAIELSCRTDASSSSSSSSTFDDCRGRRDGGGDDRHPHRYHHTNHSAADDFSLVSGLRRMRLAETLVDQAIVTGGGSGEGGTDSDDCGTESGQGEIFVLRDDKNRRLTGTMLNLRHRIINNFRVSSHSSLKKEIKAARQLGVIMGAFTLCFLPYFILFLVVAFCHDCIEPGLLTAATWVGYLNSTLNPFLYPLCNAAFRRKFRTMLRYRPSSSSSSARYNYYERNSMTRARYD